MKKAFLFDFDETLATTDARIIVRGNKLDFNDVVARLTPTEFNTFVLPDHCCYDFDEFRDDDFIHRAEPLFLMHLAKEVHDEGHAVHILTAREDDVQDAIRVFMLKHGIDVDGIICVGGALNIAERKRNILQEFINEFDKVFFYDDSEDNVNIYNHEKLRTYLIDS